MKLILLITILFVPVVHGKDVLVSCRFLSFEPAKDGITSLVAPGKDGKPETVPLTVETMSDPVVLKPENGVITFRKGESDTAVAATANIPPTTKDAIILLIPTQKEGLVHETLVLDASAKSFPKGSSIILNHCPEKAKVTVGEHEIEIKPDESAQVTRPKEINEFNMASIKFQVETNGTWRIAFESNIRLVEDQRNLFVTYVDSATKRPRFWIFKE